MTETGPEEEPALGEGFYAALLDDDVEELYENAPCAYLSARPDGTLLKVNRTFLAWTGYERDDVVGRTRFQQLLAPGDRIFYETHVLPLLAMQGHVREIAVQLVGRSGQRLPVLVNSILSRDDAGRPLTVRTAIFDATERRAYEQELLAARRRAEESEERATALARVLQASFLPPAILSVPGLDIGAAYRPAGDGTQVGGDFYDLFETGRGTWAVVLGDVCGKGPTAAVLTALARHTVRAEALHSSRPSTVLAGLHDALLHYYPRQFCTALFAVIHPEGPRLTISSAGHPLPIRVRADGQAGTLGRTGTIVGILDTCRLADTDDVLAPGDVVVLYTDGVTEARHEAELFDEGRLVSLIISEAGRSAQDVADRIVSAALAFQDGNPRDDIAVVVIRVPGVS